MSKNRDLIYDMSDSPETEDFEQLDSEPLQLGGVGEDAPAANDRQVTTPGDVHVAPQMPTPIDGTLRQFALRVPDVIDACSGIMVFGKRIKSLVFSTDLSIIRNVNADAVFAVYPFTPQPIITQALLMASDLPVFVGVGGGLTTGKRVVNLAMYAEMQGATGVVVNAPTPGRILNRIRSSVDVPVVVTVANSDTNYRHRIEDGAAILNVAAGAQTPEIVAEIRERFPDYPIIATGGADEQSIRATIRAGANAIVWTPPSSAELFRDVMKNYREGKPHPRGRISFAFSFCYPACYPRARGAATHPAGCAAAPLLRFLIPVLQCREHDTCLLARHALARTEAAVGHAADHAGALQRLHGGQGIGCDVTGVRERDGRDIRAQPDAEALGVTIDHDGHILPRDVGIGRKRGVRDAMDDAVFGCPADIGRIPRICGHIGEFSRLVRGHVRTLQPGEHGHKLRARHVFGGGEGRRRHAGDDARVIELPDVRIAPAALGYIREREGCFTRLHGAVSAVDIVHQVQIEQVRLHDALVGDAADKLHMVGARDGHDVPDAGTEGDIGIAVIVDPAL